MSNKLFTGVIHVSAYIHEVDSTGELGKTHKVNEVKNFIIPVSPTSLEECVKKVQEKLQKIKESGN